MIKRTEMNFEIGLLSMLHRKPMLCDVIWKSGYPPKNFEIIPKSFFRRKLKKNIEEYQSKYPQPLTLQRLAANVIRTSLRPNAVAGLKHLQLPPGFDSSVITLGLTKENFHELFKWM